MREQTAWTEHALFMDSLADEGFVVLGGLIGDGTRTLLAIDAESKEAVYARLADDPWSTMHLLTIASLDAWTILLKHTPASG